MLTGDNGILTRAGEANDDTVVGQEKESVELAYISATMKKIGDSVTATDLQTELNSSVGDGETSVRGTNKLYVHFNDTNHDYTIINGTINYDETLAEKRITLALTQSETESRAVKLKVTATIARIIKTPSELEKELDPKGTGDTPKLREKILSVCNECGSSFSSWSELEDAIQQGPQTPSSLFEIVNSESEYTSIYQWLIEMETIAMETTGRNITLKCSNGEEITGKSGEFTITTNGTYTVTATIENARYEDYYGEESLIISKCLNRKDNQAETYTEEATTADAGKNSKTVIALDNKTVEVPAGFYYGTSSNVGKVSTGFVITDSTDGNGNSTGNEFVWIPVDKTTLKVIGADGEITDKVMAVKDGDNYSGVFYDFSEGTSTLENGYSCEPALITFSPWENGLWRIGLDESSFESALISDYNAMIESVKTYGGFYVARYEMGVENNRMTSKIGVRPANSSSDGDTPYWYGLYKMAKTYTTSSVQSSMIWGSQYDAMMNFALTGEDKLKVTATNNVNHSGSRTKTGTYEGSDVINNIYDLDVNKLEWTLEVHNGNTRTRRDNGSRVTGAKPGDYTSDECRTTLYIK